MDETDATTILHHLGLSHQAAAAYYYLTRTAPVAKRTSAVAEILECRPQNASRTLRELEAKGFICRLEHPAGAPQTTVWRARPLTDALNYYAAYLRNLAQPLL